MFLAIGCSSVALGGGGGVAPGADGEGSGGGNSGVGATSQWVGGGRGNSGGSTVRVLRPLRTALHTISISLQNSLS